MVSTEAGKVIKISELTSEEVGGKLDVLPVQEALDTIDLPKYGNGIKSIHIIIVAVPPENTLHSNRAEFDSKERSATLELKLSYPHVLEAKKDEVTIMAANLFLVSIDLFPGLSINDFDFENFKMDVGSALKAKRLL